MNKTLGPLLANRWSKNMNVKKDKPALQSGPNTKDNKDEYSQWNHVLITK